MQNISDSQIAQIRKHLDAISVILNGTQKEPAEFEITPQIQKVYDDARELDVCLNCGKTLGMRPTRGLCQSCFNKAQARIRTGNATELQLMRAKVLMPVGVFNRKQQQKQTIIDKMSSAYAAEIAEMENAGLGPGGTRDAKHPRKNATNQPAKKVNHK